MKKLFLLIIFLSGCAKSIIPLPETVIPGINPNPSPSADYGSYPANYQKILKDFLKANIKQPEDAKLEFVNKPRKIALDHLGDDYYGYRICLSINQKNPKSIYTGYKNHFFLIYNDKIILHLFDSGLLKIPFELCVHRTEDRTIFIDDIPDLPVPEITPEVTIEEMDDPSLINKVPRKEQDKSYTQDIYILCNINNKEFTYVFNQSKNMFNESIGIDTVPFETVEFSKTHILGKIDDKEILINRVSGSIYYTDNQSSNIKGQCELLDNKKF
tara:strand:+ start:978 stop:1790 length:813 start_codon:yes stop_codon:yes gene_type:complete